MDKKEEIFKVLWEKTETAYKKGTSESITVLTEDKFDEFIEDLVKICNISDIMQQRELLIAFAKYMEEDKMYARHDEANADDFLENYSNQ